MFACETCGEQAWSCCARGPTPRPATAPRRWSSAASRARRTTRTRGSTSRQRPGPAAHLGGHSPLAMRSARSRRARKSWLRRSSPTSLSVLVKPHPWYLTATRDQRRRSSPSQAWQGRGVGAERLQVLLGGVAGPAGILVDGHPQVSRWVCPHVLVPSWGRNDRSRSSGGQRPLPAQVQRVASSSPTMRGTNPMARLMLPRSSMNGGRICM